MDLEDGSMEDIPTRRMRVKILYTFDQDSKTNCLARIPDVLDIPVVEIDETSQVGVIDLKQCIQAIVSASPEIVSRLSDGDFTIYAFDYSEYDIPQVGQGMLSAALVAATPASQTNQNMITGRVCQNKVSLLTNGVKEILEVKLRLVPVPRPAHAQQNDFAKGMNLGGERSMSPAVSTGFDPNVWNQNSKSQQQQMNDYFNFESMSATATGGGRDNNLIEDMFGLGTSTSVSGGSGHQLAGGVGIPQTPNDPFNPAFSHSAPGSRAGSPIIPPESVSRNDLLRHQSFSGHPSNLGGYTADNSRPGSRASVRSESNHQRQASTPALHHPQPQQQRQEMLQQTEVYYNEDGQPRKRAKVMQADWRGRSSFGSKSADLRVTAATAASMHMQRPIAKRPAAPGSNLEPPPRVPTPVPQRTVHLPQQQIAPRRSLLRQASAADSDFMSDADNFSDALISSPEEGDDSPGNSIAADGTPQEIPSSPPVFPGMHLAQPSSPGLPTFPPSGRVADSGYMSDLRGFGSNVMESLERDEADRSPDAQDYEMAARYKPRKGNAKSQIVIGSDGFASAHVAPPPYPSEGYVEMNINLETPGDMNQLPNRMLLNIPPRRERDASQGPNNRRTSSTAPRQWTGMPGPMGPMQGSESMSQAYSAPTPSEASNSRRGSLALPPKPLEQSCDPANPAGLNKPEPKKRPSMQRTRTSSNESEVGSPAPSDTEGPNGKPRGNQRSGSGAQRRKIIEERLQDSIAKGQTPQYCSHCGAIETPTWRRLYVKQCSGKPTGLDSHEGYGETIGVAVTDSDPMTGEPTQFVIRKSMKKTKESQPGEGFEDTMVCNPCGLWFNKFKTMRPPEKWGRRSGTRKPRNKAKTNEGDFGMSTDGIEPQSEAFFTDQVMPDDAGDDGDVDGEGQVDGADEQEADLPRMPPPLNRPRANSMSIGGQRRGGSHAQWNASQLNAALAREVQSSPARLEGSKQSPIEVADITPKPTRRLLFPSPRKNGEVKSLDDNSQVSLKAMPPALTPGQLLKEGIEISFDQTDASVFEAFTFDKENLAPGIFDGSIADEDLARLFENGSPTTFFKTPFKTPRKSPRLNGSRTTPRSLRQLSHLLRTPTPGKSNKRKPLTPNANAANGADLNAFMTSPSSSRYFLRSTPSRISRTNTPGRQNSGSSNNNGISPFSRHLAQMLSDVDGGHGTSQQFTSSPSRALPAAFDFSDLPTFTTPGRPGALTEADWEGLDGMLSEGFGTDGFEDGSAL